MRPAGGNKFVADVTNLVNRIFWLLSGNLYCEFNLYKMYCSITSILYHDDLYGVDAMTLDQLTALMADDEAKN